MQTRLLADHRSRQAPGFVHYNAAAEKSIQVFNIAIPIQWYFVTFPNLAVREDVGWLNELALFIENLIHVREACKVLQGCSGLPPKTSCRDLVRATTKESLLIPIP